MHVTSFTDYAMRVLLYSAVRPDERCLTGNVAAAFGISRHHVVKVVNELRHLGYVETTRGRDGGFALSRTTDRIRLGELVRRTEGLALVECFDKETNTCPLSRACGLKGVLKEAAEAFLGVLDRYTLADMVADPRRFAQVVSLAVPVKFTRKDKHA